MYGRNCPDTITLGSAHPPHNENRLELEMCCDEFSLKHALESPVIRHHNPGGFTLQVLGLTIRSVWISSSDILKVVFKYYGIMLL